MGLFPWQDWFYNISQREQDLTTEYNNYISLCQTISANGAKLNTDINTLDKMYLYNYALLIILTQTKMDQSDYAQWLEENQALETAYPQNSTVVEVFQGASELTGLIFFGKFIWGLGSAIKNTYWSNSAEEVEAEATDEELTSLITMIEPETVDVADDISLTESGQSEASSITDAASESGFEAGSEAGIDAVDVAIESGSTASYGLAASGIGILAAVGLDAILGAIEGSTESKELDKAKATLDDALTTTQKFADGVNDKNSEVNAKILDQQAIFLDNMKLLIKIQSATFDYDYDATDLNNASLFTSAMTNAVSEYGFLTTIRTDWENYKDGGQTDWDTFASFMKMIKPSDMTETVADSYLSYAKDKLILPS